MHNIDLLSESEQKELLELIGQEEKERVTDKMELFRQAYRIKIAHGGRGAGAKSWSAASLLIQIAHRNPVRICCFREVQKSLEESSYKLMTDTIERLGYKGWNITKEALDSPAGAHIIFRGLVDMRAANQMKSLEGYSYFWLEEAAKISKESLMVLLPTLRKEGSELWATLNREKEKDPIIAELWDSPRTDVLRIELEEGKIDNPWFPDVLEQERITAYEINPNDAMHVWGGKPRVRFDNEIFTVYNENPSLFHISEVPKNDVKLAILSLGLDYGTGGEGEAEKDAKKGKTSIQAVAITEGFSHVYCVDEITLKANSRAQEIVDGVIDFIIKLQENFPALPIIVYAEWAGSDSINRQIKYDIGRRNILGVRLTNCFKGKILGRIDLCKLLLDHKRIFFTDKVPNLKNAFKTALWDIEETKKKGIDTRLDNGTTPIDQNDCFEYAINSYAKYLLAYTEKK